MTVENSKRELFENKPVFKAITELALPSIVGQIILVIYNMADTFFVSLAKGEGLITAVGVCMPAFMFLSAISNLFGVGGASVMSRAMGQKKMEKARLASAFAFWGCLAVTLLYSLGAYLFLDEFVDILGGGNPAVHELARSYIIVAVVLGGLPTAVNTLMAHLLRGEGKSFQASVGIVLGGVLNVILDPLFMFVILKPGQEALGAAIATALSNTIALLYYVVIIVKNRKKLVISVRFTPEFLRNRIPGDVISVGTPACLMTLCENISYAILDNLMEGYGVLAYQDGIGVAKKVNMLAHSVVRGMTQGVLPLIGYNYASGNRKRMEKVLYLSAAISFGISLLCMAVCLIAGYPITNLFFLGKENPEAHGYAFDFLRILCVGAPFSALAYTVISFFQAVGKSFSSLILALMRKGIIDIPLMFILQPWLQKYGIVLATPLADLLCAVAAVLLYWNFIKKHRRETAELKV